MKLIERCGVFYPWTQGLKYMSYNMYPDLCRGFYYGNRQHTEQYIHKLAVL